MPGYYRQLVTQLPSSCHGKFEYQIVSACIHPFKDIKGIAKATYSFDAYFEFWGKQESDLAGSLIQP